jgi:hypothetical protein
MGNQMEKKRPAVTGACSPIFTVYARGMDFMVPTYRNPYLRNLDPQSQTLWRSRSQP